MNTRRTAKMSQAIREQVSSNILFDVKDPRVQNVTVIDVEMSSDLQHAKVYVSVMGDEAEKKLCLHGLNSARGFLQSKIGDRLKTRYTPILSFALDDGVKRSFETASLLEEIAEQTDDVVDHSMEEDNVLSEEGEASAELE